MSMREDVQSLLRDPDLDGDLRSVLDAAGDHEPSGADLASLGQRLAALLPPGTLPPAPAPPTPPAGPTSPPAPGAPPIAGASSSIATKVIVGLAIAGAVATAAWLMRSPPADTTPVATVPSAFASEAPSAVPEVPVTTSVVALPDAAPSAAPSTTAHVAPVASPTAAASAEPEIAILARAHDALLHGSPDRALAIAGEHARAYPRGLLAQEREVIAIEALASTGRRDEARARAAAFRAAYPGSSHRARIDRLVEAP
jgi:hypothetical protein